MSASPVPQAEGIRQGAVPPRPSVRLELELAILASEPLTPAAEPPEPAKPAPPGEGQGPAGRGVLIVAADTDLRRYVRQCLEPRGDLCVREAGSAAAARQAAEGAAALLVVAEGEAAVLEHFPTTPAILLAEEVSEALPGPGEHVAPRALLVGPFAARRLCEQVELLLARAPP